ncbi:MAG TPA: hypothetical protein VFB23_00920 [Candidatus Acidoferrales bacterium]|nr:hypothetical protein [Candidatus Acidoferrales bacterium]
MRLRTCAHICALLLVAAPTLAGPPLPKLEGLQARGCELVQHGGMWEATFWADHQLPDDGPDDFVVKRDFRLVLGRRAGKNARRKAMLDCDDYMNAVDKAVQKSKR